MAKLVADPYPLPDIDWSKGFPESVRESEEAFNALLAKSNALPEGEVVGGMLRWQRADGYAWYLVTKDRPLTLQHVPFMDAWTVEPALIKGLDREDVLDMLDRARRLNTLFGR